MPQKVRLAVDFDSVGAMLDFVDGINKDRCEADYGAAATPLAAYRMDALDEQARAGISIANSYVLRVEGDRRESTKAVR